MQCVLFLKQHYFKELEICKHELMPSSQVEDGLGVGGSLQTEAIIQDRELPSQRSSIHAQHLFMVALPQSVWAEGSGLCLFLFCLLSWGTWMRGWGPNKRQIMGLLGGTNELSLGNGSQKEREVWGSIEAHLQPEREGRCVPWDEQLRSSFPHYTCSVTIWQQQGW